MVEHIFYFICSCFHLLWFSNHYLNFCFSLINLKSEPNQRLLSIKPISVIPYALRSIGKRHLWKAYELLAFIIYYSWVLLNDFLPHIYYENLILLVIALELLLSPSIVRNDLEVLNQIFKRFVKQCSEIYPSENMLSRMHELLHLVQCTEGAWSPKFLMLFSIGGIE